MASSKVQSFDGKGDVKVFIEKFSLYAALKGYDEDKHDKLLASSINPPVFDV